MVNSGGDFDVLLNLPRPLHPIEGASHSESCNAQRRHCPDLFAARGISESVWVGAVIGLENLGYFPIRGYLCLTCKALSHEPQLVDVNVQTAGGLPRSKGSSLT